MTPADVKYWLATDKCEGCNGHGMVGGLRQDGYHSEECPFCKGSGNATVDARPIALEALELVAMQPATRGVYLLDQQDMDFVKRAVKALKEQS